MRQQSKPSRLRSVHGAHEKKHEDIKGFSYSPLSVMDAPDMAGMPPITLPRQHRRPPILYKFGAIASITALVLAPLGSLFVTLAPQVSWGVLCAGFFAQLVDGSLGMGFGITSSTIMAASCPGLSPASVSSAVHLAQLGTTAVSGYSHKRCGNVDDQVMRRLTPAGVIGALLGSTLLSSLASATSKLASGSLLLLVGAYLLVRFARAPADGPTSASCASPPSALVLAPLGLIGGIVDAIGGGGWGPVATSGLLAAGGCAPPTHARLPPPAHTIVHLPASSALAAPFAHNSLYLVPVGMPPSRLAPSEVVGSVSLSEFFVTVSAVAGFIGMLGLEHALSGAHWDALLLLLGGLLAAPIAPLLVRFMEPRRLGMLVGGFICITNLRVLPLAARMLR